MHDFNWQLGHEGKGNYYPDGSVHTWNINELSEPHHDEAALSKGMSPSFRFYISPEGGLHDGGIGFTNSTGKPDNDVVRDVAGQTPAVWDARGQVFDDFGVTPRVEDGYGGYGHAQNLIPSWQEEGTYARAKLAKEEGWADFHTELKLPLSARRKIRKWVDRLKWPEGSSKDDTRRYHITILSMDEYDEDFAKWAKAQMRGKSFHFESTGMDIFADEHVVLRFKSPEWTALVREWTAKAKEEGLEPHIFEPPKAHVTLGKSPSGKWPQGIPDPHVKFDTATFNINKNSAAGDPWQPGVWGKGMYVNDEPHVWETTSPSEGGLMPIHGDYARQQGEDGSFRRDAPIVVTPDGTYAPGPDYDWSPMERGSEDPLAQRELDEWNRRFDSYGEQGLTRRVTPDQWHEEMKRQAVPASGYGHGNNVLDILNRNSAIQWASGDGVCDECGETQIGKDAEDGVAICSNCGAHIPVHGDPHSSGWKVAEVTPAEELLSWVQTQTPQEQATPVSLHHTSPEDMLPQTQAPVVQTPHIDPPKHPYAPYNWADNGFEESPLNMTSANYESPPKPPCTICGKPSWTMGWCNDCLTKINNHEMDLKGNPIGEGVSPPFEIKPVEPQGDGDKWLGAFIHGQPAGSIGYTPDAYGTGETHRVYVDNLDVPEEHKRKGIGTKLVNAMREETGATPDTIATQTFNHWPEGEHFWHNYFTTNGVPYPEPQPSDEEHTAAFGTHPCPQCEQQIEGAICPHCGYDPQHSQSDYERSKNDWYDRAWSDPGAQPRPVPGQPMHWGPRDHATDVRFASGSDQQDNAHIADSAPEASPQESPRPSTDADPQGISKIESSAETSIYDVPSQQSDEIGWATKQNGWRLLN